MKPSSAKAKGRIHQQYVRDLILRLNPELTKDDVRSTSMGAGGEDIQLSSAARRWFPFQIECKSKAAYSVYGDYEQACSHGGHEPLLIIKANHKKPLAIVDAEYFAKLVRRLSEI